MSAKSKIIRIESAEYVGANKLHLLFSDGKERIVDFGPFLGKSQHPQIRKFLSQKTFKNFTVESGELVWGDFDLIFPIMDLYHNRLHDRERTTSTSEGPSTAK